MQQEEAREKKRIYKVYTIVEKPGADKDYWMEIGIATVNRDSSISAKLDALPVNGRVHIREYEGRKQDSFQQNNRPSQQWRQKGNFK